MSVLLHDPMTNVSVKIAKGADGSLSVSIKGPEDIAVSYNGTQLMSRHEHNVATFHSNQLGGGASSTVGGAGISRYDSQGTVFAVSGNGSGGSSA